MNSQDKAKLLASLKEGTNRFKEMMSTTGRDVRAAVCNGEAIEAIRSEVPPKNGTYAFDGISIHQCDVMEEPLMFYFSTANGAKSFIDTLEILSKKGLAWPKIKEYVTTGQGGLRH